MPNDAFSISAFWWIALALLAIVLFVRLRNGKRAKRAFSAFDEAQTWFASQGIDPKLAMFSSYQDDKLARYSGATVIVGNSTCQGREIGFAIEVMPGRGVVASELLSPAGIATWHKSAALQARTSGKPLLSILAAMAAGHRARHSANSFVHGDSVTEDGLEADQTTPSSAFMAAIPHPEIDIPLKTLSFDREQVVISYYENPSSIGEIFAGIEQPFERSQVAVIHEGVQPVMIVQVEKTSSGTLLLCTLDPKGRHRILGPFKPDSRWPLMEGFIAQAVKTFNKAKQ